MKLIFFLNLLKHDSYEENRLSFIVRLDYLNVLMRLFCALKRKKCQQSKCYYLRVFSFCLLAECYYLSTD